jgi:hypothetical protein
MSLTFDGSTAYIQRSANLQGIADSDAFTLSLWFKATANPGNILLGINSGGNRIGLSIESSTGKVAAVLRNSSNTVLYAGKTATDYSDSVWHHLALAADLSATTVHLYLDRISDEVVSVGPTSGTIDFTGITEWIIGANTGGTSNFFTGDIDDIIFWPGYFLDISSADNLRKLVSSDGLTESVDGQYRQHARPTPLYKPVGYGATGDLPTGGVKPILRLADNFRLNRGTGGNFTVNGTFAASRGPNAYRQSALRSTPGERWFDSEQSGFSYPRSETVIETREGISSVGKRIGKDEVDDRTRNERPSVTFSQLLIGQTGREDDSEERR